MELGNCSCIAEFHFFSLNSYVIFKFAAFLK